MKFNTMQPVRFLLMALGLFSGPLFAQSTDADPLLSKYAKEEYELTIQLEAVQKKINARRDELNGGVKRLPGRITSVPAEGSDSIGKRFEKFRTDYNLQVRQSVIDKVGLEKPALFQYSMPSGGPDSWITDLGASVEHEFPDGRIVRGLLEYHFNDAEGSEKDSFIGGVGMAFEVGTKTLGAQTLTLDVGYKNDDVLSGEGITSSLVWLPSYSEWGIGDFWWNMGPISGRVAPFIGIEEEIGDGALSTFKDGDRTSFKAGLLLKGLILPNHFGNRLEADVSISWWDHLVRTGGYEEYSKDQFSFSSGVTYWLGRPSVEGGSLTDEEKHFGISAKYTNGDNPLTGEFDQNIWTFGFSVKY